MRFTKFSWGCPWSTECSAWSWCRCWAPLFHTLGSLQRPPQPAARGREDSSEPGEVPHCLLGSCLYLSGPQHTGVGQPCSRFHHQIKWARLTGDPQWGWLCACFATAWCSPSFPRPARQLSAGHQWRPSSPGWRTPYLSSSDSGTPDYRAEINQSEQSIWMDLGQWECRVLPVIPQPRTVRLLFPNTSAPGSP